MREPGAGGALGSAALGSAALPRHPPLGTALGGPLSAIRAASSSPSLHVARTSASTIPATARRLLHGPFSERTEHKARRDIRGGLRSSVFLARQARLQIF